MRSTAPGCQRRSNPRRYSRACSGAAELRHSVFAEKIMTEAACMASRVFCRDWTRELSPGYKAGVGSTIEAPVADNVPGNTEFLGVGNHRLQPAYRELIQSW